MSCSLSDQQTLGISFLPSYSHISEKMTKTITCHIFMTVKKAKKVLATRYFSKYFIQSLAELVCAQGNHKYFVE